MSSTAEHPSQNRINGIFASLRENGRKGLMPFLCAGYPSRDDLVPSLLAAEDGGASIVELGIPFSDPIADGPVIASAMHRALQDGIEPRHVFDQVASARDRLSIGLVAMVTVSIVHRLGGPEGFTEEARAAGFDGLIVPDCPIEESDEITAACASRGMSCSLLIAPTTSEERAARIAGASTGFAYLVARTGITGESSDIPDIGPRVEHLRSTGDLPIACGFGVSTPEHVAAVVEHADAAIVGSALVRRMGDADQPAQAVGEFVCHLASGLDRDPSS